MSKVVRLSDIMISRLENLRSSEIYRFELLKDDFFDPTVEIQRLNDMSISDLVEYSIRSALVSSEMNVERLSNTSGT